MQKKQTSILFRSYLLEHKANPGKVDLLFKLYEVYKKEYKFHIHQYWNLFQANKIKNNKFSHLTSTKHVSSKLNQSYLQACLFQACSSLNSYNANIQAKFNNFLSKSNIKGNLLHELRTINSKNAWLNNYVCYYPEFSRNIVDDFGNIIQITYKKETVIGKSSIRLARKMFNNITKKERVKFPNLSKPRLILDSRTYSLESSKVKSFDYWLKISTLISRKVVAIPINKNDFFVKSNGTLGSTIELEFQSYCYEVQQHKHDSLFKSKYKSKSFQKINRKINIIFNKKCNLEDFYSKQLYLNEPKNKIVSFDLGLCNFIATSDGHLLGKYWLKKLTEYDKKIQSLASTRQTLGLKTKSKRFDILNNQVRGFIKTEINRILNLYFQHNQNLKTVVIEKLKFSSPELSKRLNRIIQNFGYNLFKQKLIDLSVFYGFEIEELNPAYTSQECVGCGYVAENNRKTQSMFTCLCCGKKLNADIQSSRTNLKRFKSKQNSVFKTGYKGTILRALKLNFVINIDTMISNGKVGRRYLYELLKENKYFKGDLKNIVKTTEASGVKPMTFLNFDKYLTEYYS